MNVVSAMQRLSRLNSSLFQGGQTRIVVQQPANDESTAMDS